MLWMSLSARSQAGGVQTARSGVKVRGFTDAMIACGGSPFSVSQ